MKHARAYVLSFCFVLLIALAALVSAIAQGVSPTPPPPAPAFNGVAPSTQSTPRVVAVAARYASLSIVGKSGVTGMCPLRHTDVKAGISGFIARVLVTQEFENTSAEKIEAIYTFPLPDEAAVDDMTIEVGGRTIRGVIKKREEAKQIYERAVQQGKMAALLDQERPNIFTQSVGNIPPQGAVRITIAYVERLKYEEGSYEFTFPMVVGPRYIPGTKAIGQQGGGFAPDTDQVPDASRVTPPIAPPGTRAGHDISVAVALDAGVPIQDVRSPTHQIDIDNTGATSAMVHLQNAAEIPNKDFILRYDVAGAQIADGMLTHAESSENAQLVPASTAVPPQKTNGYFTLILQPPQRFPETDLTPKELVFVLDSSGSMNGFPEAKAKQFIDKALEGLYPGDTFNVIKFSGDTAILFPKPVYPSADNIARAREFVDAPWGGGGTEMMKAIVASLAPSDSQDHLRVVVFLTDGYVGNDMEIVGEVQKHPNARVFAYGVGSSVNHFLLDKMAQAGRGEVEYVSAKQDEKEAEDAAHRLYERLRSPLLTDISLDFGDLPVTDVYPRQINDLFSGKPVVVTGRYTGAAKGTVHLRARRAGDTYTRDIPVTFPAQNSDHPVLASLWAREKIDDLMAQDWSGLQQGEMRADLRNQITRLALDYQLMSQFTSFVAVEERVVTEGGKPKRIQVPVELPEGVQYEEGWGDRDKLQAVSNSPMTFMAKLAVPTAVPARIPQKVVVGGVAGGVPGGQMGGVVGGIIATPSNATGSGGGIGSSNGPGIGPGRGGGYGGGVFRVGGGVSAPKTIHAPEPSCPAANPKCSGSVVLRVLVGQNGSANDIKVARSAGNGLDEQAVAAVRKWKFEPAMKDGKPVATQINVELLFGVGTHSITATGDASAGATTASRPSAISQKFSPDLVGAYDCWKQHANPHDTRTTCKLPNDNIAVEVVTSAGAGDVRRLLESLGLTNIRPVGRNRLRGNIGMAKLASLADLRTVQFVGRAPEEAARK